MDGGLYCAEGLILIKRVLERFGNEMAIHQSREKVFVNEGDGFGNKKGLEK